MAQPRLSPFLRNIAGFCGLILVLAAIFLLASDLIAALESGGQLVASRVRDIWSATAPNGLIGFSGWAATHLPLPLVRLADCFLSFYVWLVTGLAGVLLGCLSGPHRHK